MRHLKGGSFERLNLLNNGLRIELFFNGLSFLPLSYLYLYHFNLFCKNFFEFSFTIVSDENFHPGLFGKIPEKKFVSIFLDKLIFVTPYVSWYFNVWNKYEIP